MMPASLCISTALFPHLSETCIQVNMKNHCFKTKLVMITVHHSQYRLQHWTFIFEVKSMKISSYSNPIRITEIISLQYISSYIFSISASCIKSQVGFVHIWIFENMGSWGTHYRSNFLCTSLTLCSLFHVGKHISCSLVFGIWPED